MLILIPPSERKSKVESTETVFQNTNFKFSNEVSEIIRVLKDREEKELQSIYSTSIEKSEQLHLQNLNIFQGKCAPAIERYTGVVYSHIDWNNLNLKSQEYIEEHLRIFSGLFGIVTPKTLIPEYKLKMNVLSLDKFWKPILTKELKAHDLIIDLLPQVHRKAYQPAENVTTIDFFQIKKGKKVSAGHLGKSVKGEFVKFLATNQINKINDIKSFSFDGFNWNEGNFIKEIK